MQTFKYLNKRIIGHNKYLLSGLFQYFIRIVIYAYVVVETLSPVIYTPTNSEINIAK